jgi:CRP-like cAMP-binding protein
MQIRIPYLKENDPIIATLMETPIFNAISAHDIATMLDCLNPRFYDYQKNETIAVAGDPFSGLGIVISGHVMVTKESLDGNRTIMSLLKKGEMFGEMVCFSPNPKWPATIMAQLDATVLFISPQKVISQCEQVCSGHRKLIENLLGIMSRKALMLNRKVDYLTLKTLRGKLCAFLLEQSNKEGSEIFMLSMNRDEIADFLNVTRPSVSRELGNMRDDGLIDFYKASFKILDIASLKRSIV